MEQPGVVGGCEAGVTIQTLRRASPEYLGEALHLSLVKGFYESLLSTLANWQMSCATSGEPGSLRFRWTLKSG
jgi:hypothetical protein